MKPVSFTSVLHYGVFPKPLCASAAGWRLIRLLLTHYELNLHSIYRLKPRGPGGRVWMGPWEMVVWRWGCGVRDWMGKCPFRRSRQRVYSLRHVKNCNMVPVHSSCPTISSTASAPQYCESSLYCFHVPGQVGLLSMVAPGLLYTTLFFILQYVRNTVTGHQLLLTYDSRALAS